MDNIRLKTFELFKPRGESPYIDWNREVVLKSNQILEVETLPKPIDIFELGDFEKALDRANQLKQKYLEG